MGLTDDQCIGIEDHIGDHVRRCQDCSLDNWVRDAASIGIARLFCRLSYSRRPCSGGYAVFLCSQGTQGLMLRFSCPTTHYR